MFLAYLSPMPGPEGGLGQAMTAGDYPPAGHGATVFTLVLVLLVWGLAGLAVLAMAGLVVWGLSRYFVRRLGGVTGDVSAR